MSSCIIELVTIFVSGATWGTCPEFENNLNRVAWLTMDSRSAPASSLALATCPDPLGRESAEPLPLAKLGQDEPELV